MTRIAGDSTTLADIPLTVQVAGTYGTGTYATTEAEVEARFPHSRYGWCRFDVTGAMPSADARDWETGDKSGSLEQWVIDHNADSGKKDAVVYCDRSTIPEVRQLTGTQVLGRDYFLYVSTLDGTLFGPAQYPGVIACQIKGAQLTGGHWDMSIVFDGSLWLPVTPPAPPTPVPSALKDELEKWLAQGVALIARVS